MREARIRTALHVLCAVTLACALVSGCASQKQGAESVATGIMQVAAYPGDCEGGNTDSCLVVKQGLSDNWHNFTGDIQGFEFEAGNAYELQVEIHTVTSEGDTTTNQKWILQKVLNRTRAAEDLQQAAAGNLLYSSWRVAALGDPSNKADFQQIGISEDVSLQFADEEKVSGQGGCNSFFASYATGPDQSLTIKSIGATKMACVEHLMDLETRFFTILEQVATYRVWGDMVLVDDQDGQQVMILKPLKY